jgi:CHAD domain-containing protein
MDILRDTGEQRAAAAAPGNDKGGIGAALAAAGRDILADARRGLIAPELSPAEAVHDIRKALKRWRALMRLLTPILGEPADLMRRDARELMRGLAGARDAQACLDALDDLAKSDPELSPQSMERIRDRLAALRTQAEARGFSDSIREQLSGYLDGALLTLERWPLADIAFPAIADALTVTYRRARQIVPDDWAKADADHLHDLRRRVVEHRHQMELIEHLWPRLGRLWTEEAQRLRTRLGACQDLVVFEQMTGPRRPLAPWRSRLTPMILARREAHVRAAARLAGRLFAEKPKAFRRRIGKLWDHRSRTGDEPASATRAKPSKRT